MLESPTGLWTEVNTVIIREGSFNSSYHKLRERSGSPKLLDLNLSIFTYLLGKDFGSVGPNLAS